MSVFSSLLDDPTCAADILSCVYELNELETAAYFALVARGRTRMDVLASKLERDRSTVYRAVHELMRLGLVDREATPMDGGGYYYEYTATPPEQVRELIEARLEQVRRVVREGLERFEHEVRERSAEGVPTAG